MNFKGLLASKRFKAAIGTVIFIVIQEGFGVTMLDEAMIQNLVIVISAWIVGDSYRPIE